MMEVYAGYLSQTDYNVGRVLDAIAQLGQLDNTLVIYIVGDNGASAEGMMQGSLNEIATINGIQEDYKEVLKHKDDLGTWKTHNHYPIGWAHAMDTPFQWTSSKSLRTTVAPAMGWSSPGRHGIKDQGGIRSQWHHTIDIVPTILDVTGLQQPSVVNGVAQKPIEGVSMAYTFDDAKAPSTRRTQYFEMFGNAASITMAGWPAQPQDGAMGGPAHSWDCPGDVISGYKWELYHVAEDFSEAVNLADKNPDKLHELQLLFYAEAARYNVLPLDDSQSRALGRVHSAQPDARAHRVHLLRDPDAHPGGRSARREEQIVPHHRQRGPPKGDEQGVVLTQGGLSAGYALMFRDGKPIFHYNVANVAHFNIAAKDALTPGKHTVVVRLQVRRRRHRQRRHRHAQRGRQSRSPRAHRQHHARSFLVR